MNFIDRVKENIQETAAMAREGLEGFHSRRALDDAYAELGRTAFQLVESGKLEAAELSGDVERVRQLQAELDAEAPGATGPSQT